MKKPAYRIPFMQRGNVLCMCEYTSMPEDAAPSPHRTSHVWRDVTTFDATLTIAGWHKGRSSARINVVNPKARERYSLAFGAMYDAVVAFGVTPGGIIAGTWTFRKQGANYTLWPVVKS